MNESKVLAIVGNKEITSNDVEQLLKSLDPNSARQFNSDEGRKQLLQELVNQELFYLDAIENKLDELKDYKEEVEKAKSNILKQFAVTNLLKGVSVQEEELIDHYNKNKSYFTSQEKVKASHILVDDENKALEILDEINSGLSFEKAAEEYSSCPSKEVGGDLGYFGKGNMVPEFEKAAFEMKIGEISKPVKTQFGYHIIKLVDKKDAGQKSFDEMKNQLFQQVLLKKQQDLYISKTNELKNKYSVKFNQ